MLCTREEDVMAGPGFGFEGHVLLFSALTVLPDLHSQAVKHYGATFTILFLF